jgi:uncharacterized protein (DUF885 family)
MSRVFEIADHYIDEIAALEPITATGMGIPGHEREMPDLSPAGPARLADLNIRTTEALATAAVEGEPDRIAREVMLERLGVSLAIYRAKEYQRALRIIASPLTGVRQVFDLMPKATEEDWSNIAARLSLVPRTLAGYRESLSEGLRNQLYASKRQATEGDQQARAFAGLAEGEGKASFFRTLRESFEEQRASKGFSDALAKDMETGAEAAKRGYSEMHDYLANEYIPNTTEKEAAGAERYQLTSRAFLGAILDPQETYQWGWEELHRIEDEMRKTIERIVPGGTWEQAIELLENDPPRVVEGEENYRQWLQDLHDEALQELHGKHFDIPDEIRKVEVMIPPPGGALAAYYTGPSEDLSRPGRTWWPTGGNTKFAKWGDVTTVYHEGVPGHHLQVATAHVQADQLSRYQRLLMFVSGHGEGWALYSERLMAELGYLDNPDYYLGMLSGQALRAVRVIIDIGMHLELPIPAGEKFHPGKVWDHDLAVEFAVEKTGRPRQFMESEVVRYLGWPGQAISYKVGERYWLAAREAAKKAQGSKFDLKAWHTRALNIGPMGLEQMQRELAS